MITLGDVRTQLAPFVGNGVPCSSGKVGPAVKLAVDRLINQCGNHSTLRRAHLCPDACGRLTLPRQAKYIVKARPCNHVRPFDMASQYYRFLSNGPGGLANSTDMVLEDLGEHWPTFVTFPKEHLRVLLICEDSQDAGERVRVRGLDEYGREHIGADGSPGEDVTLAWGQTPETAPHYTVGYFTEITGLIKDITKGYVHVFAYRPETTRHVKLASLHPLETTSSYRRYQLPCQQECQVVEALLKLRSLALIYDHDPIIIESVVALKAMLQCMHAEDSGNLDRAKYHERIAKDVLADELREYDSMLPEFDFNPDTHGAGSIPHVI